MKTFKSLIFLGLLAVNNLSLAAIHYVGQSPQCNGTNHHDTLAIALFAAGLNGSESDEIRLTNTVTYSGAGDGTNTLAGWNSSALGELVIAGGYANCDDPANDLNAIIGNGATAVFEVANNSVVTFRDLQMVNSDSRGLIIDENSVVFLDSVVVVGNAAGIRVLGGSYLAVDENSLIVDNGDLTAIPKGGGIWCFGNNSEVEVFGKIQANQGASGGNAYIEDGCLMTLQGGSEVIGDAGLSNKSAESGGGIMVHDGGTLFANGGDNRVFIKDHLADFGAGLYVWGTGRATLLNTQFRANEALIHGSGFYAINGGSAATQVTMDRAPTCPFIISCSEFELNRFDSNVVYINNSLVNINRTLFDRNDYDTGDDAFRGMIEVTLTGTLRMSYSNMISNDAYFLLVNYGTTEMSHITGVNNSYGDNDIGEGDSFVWYTPTGSIRMENSIWSDTQGGDTRGSGVFTGKCNMIDNDNDWPVGSYVIDTPQFINSGGGDSRQVASSPGVDMCTEDTFAWSIDRDIEYQTSPVNENTNPQGMPGEGGLYDAGFDEVYDNIGEDEFLLTVQREGSGEGFIISDPLGISCGTDCTEVVFNNTLVKLTATALTGSEFNGWLNCPLPNFNECFITVTESATVRAEFQPDDLIFADGFD